MHEAHACKHCGEKLTGTEATDHERRTRIDVVFEVRGAFRGNAGRYRVQWGLMGVARERHGEAGG